MLLTQFSHAAGGDHAPRADLSSNQRLLLTAGAVLLHGIMAIVIWHSSTMPVLPPEPAPLMVSLITNEVVQPPPKQPEVEPPKPVPPKPVLTPKVQPTVVASARTPTPQDMVVPAAPEPPPPAPAVPTQSAQPTAPISTAPEPAPLPPKILPSSAVGYLVEPKLAYPPASLELGESGMATLEVLVDEQGRVKDVSVNKSSGYPRLDRAAVTAMRSARFKPYVENGVPRSVRVLAPINFKPSE